MKYLLDTNILIYAIKNTSPSVLEKLGKISNDDIYVSSITYAELVYGAMKSKNKSKNLLAVNLMLSSLNLLKFDTKAAIEYGKIKDELQKKGTPIGEMDTLIAAHAKSKNLTLVSNNLSKFNRVTGLKTDNWV